MENLKIKDLKLLTEVERFSSLRALSRHLKMEPQNLSKKIDQIEVELNAKILERSPRGISLTEEGVLIINKCKEVLQSCYEINELKSELNPYEDYLNISSRGFLVQYLSGALSNAFNNSGQNIGLRFMDQSPEAMEKSARDNQLHIVYTFGDVDLGKSWQKNKIGELPYHFVVKKDHPLKDKIKIEDFLKYRCVGMSYIEKNRVIVPSMMKVNRKTLLRGFDSENTNYTKQIILNTNQIGFLPKSAILDEVETNKLKILNITGVKNRPRSVYLEVHIDKVSNDNYLLAKNASLEAFMKFKLD